MVGTLEQVALCTVISVPIAVLVAVYLVEYGRGALARATTFMVDILTGIPSIVAALFIYAVWIGVLKQQRVGFSVSLALVLLNLMWGGSLLVIGAVFSFAQGIIHPYYSIALAPAIGALVGAGSVELWKRRDSLLARLFLAGAVATSVAWAYVLLDRTPDWNPNLKVVILVAGLVASAARRRP